MGVVFWVVASLIYVACWIYLSTRVYTSQKRQCRGAGCGEGSSYHTVCFAHGFVAYVAIFCWPLLPLAYLAHIGKRDAESRTVHKYKRETEEARAKTAALEAKTAQNRAASEAMKAENELHLARLALEKSREEASRYSDFQQPHFEALKPR